ncbi:hypothetical protein WJX74_004276 [Apatococcus lobatus]|uniref:Uncharacterized protein n=1 Tax=Apatococcus lobatus TaxID=904363 RepID=A0AAW1RBM5_9CHLO
MIYEIASSARGGSELVLQDLPTHSGPGTAGFRSVFKQLKQSVHRRVRSRSLQSKRKERLTWWTTAAQDAGAGSNA